MRCIGTTARREGPTGRARTLSPSPIAWKRDDSSSPAKVPILWNLETFLECCMARDTAGQPTQEALDRVYGWGRGRCSAPVDLARAVAHRSRQPAGHVTLI